MRYIRTLLLASAAGLCSVPVAAAAQDTTAQDGDAAVGDIIVTAQKRSESVNQVPISISAASGEQLQSQGIKDVSGLAKIVPGFQFTQSLYAIPVYTLRGVGFYDNSYAATSAVSIYVDETPLPFSAMTTGAALDVERVEVLKGPQGTLFGQNSTGGAINYVAAKPTSELKAGFDASADRFGQVDFSGFVSGPISSTIRARVSMSTTQFGAWQKSYTRNEKLGDQDRLNGRVLVDWAPTETLSFMLNVNGWRDKSDTLATQFVASSPNNPLYTVPAIAAYTPAPHNNRAADWTPGYDLSRNARFYQLALRGELELSDNVKLTSITSYARFKEDRQLDPDGMSVDNVRVQTNAKIKDFSQELRLSGEMGIAKWIIGGNYEKSSVYEFDATPFTISSVGPTFQFLGLPYYIGDSYFSDQKYKTKAGFANLDLDLTSQFTVHGGIRYTDVSARSNGCALDSPDGTLNTGLTILIGSFVPGFNIPPGGCNSFDNNFAVGLARNTLNQDNISWRAGVDFKPNNHTLLYASVSKGYKSGSFPTLNASLFSQFAAASQESILAYEAGFKLGLLGRTLQLNGAAFYYDYTDKQFRGRILNTPNIFGPVETLLNIPKSEIKGAELQLTWAPVSGLMITSAGTYLDSKVRGSYSNYDTSGNFTSFSGEAFPYTPKWQFTGDIEYRWDAFAGKEAFIGASGRYQTRTQSAFGEEPLLYIKDYGTVDLRVGIEDKDHGWKLSVFGRNVTNTHYWSNATRVLDSVVRYAGQPLTYGVSFSLRTR